MPVAAITASTVITFSAGNTETILTPKGSWDSGGDIEVISISILQNTTSSWDSGGDIEVISISNPQNTISPFERSPN